MEIIINSTTYKWESNFLNEVNKQGQNKWSKKREDYFCKEKISGVTCFIKRSEVGFEAASIFSKLIGAPSKSIPLTYGFSEVIENNKRVQYLVSEYIPGDTLDVILNSGKPINIEEFGYDIIEGIDYLNGLGYWHTDLNADNIYIANTGKSYLIDIDSCVECQYRPTHISTSVGGLTTLSNQLGSYALKYYKKYIARRSTFDYPGIPGVNLNYYQLLFLSCQIKYFLEQKQSIQSIIWKKSTFKHVNIVEHLRNVNPEYSDSVFKAGLVKPIHKELISTLINKINLIQSVSSTPIKKSPSNNISKYNRELNDLQRRFNILEREYSIKEKDNKRLNNTIIANQSKIDNLKVKISDLQKRVIDNAQEVKGFNKSAYAWALTAVIFAGLGIINYIEVDQQKEQFQYLYQSQKEDLNESKNIASEANIKLNDYEELVSDTKFKLEQYENLFDELEDNISSFHFKNAEFYNSYDEKTNTSFYNNQLTYIKPSISVFSLKNDKVVVKYQCITPTGSYYLFGQDNYVEEEIRLKRGLNTQYISSGWGREKTGSRTKGSYTYKFYVNNKYVGEKILTVM